MFERTVSTWSFGKALSVTGWRMAPACGPKHLVEPIKALIGTIFDEMSLVSELTIGHCLNLANSPYLGFDNYFAW